jgi:hypothetical protein
MIPHPCTLVSAANALLGHRGSLGGVAEVSGVLGCDAVLLDV